jgi:hypothetical protein
VTNEDLLSSLTKKQLEENIDEKLLKINIYRAGADVLRNSDDISNPYIQGRIKHLEDTIADYESAIQTWSILLDHISTNNWRIRHESLSGSEARSSESLCPSAMEPFTGGT